MANHTFIDAIDLDGILSRHNPISSSTSVEIYSCWGALLNGQPYEADDSILFPRRQTAASPPDVYTVVYSSYSDIKMLVSASLFVLEILRYTGVAHSQLPPPTLTRSFLSFEEMCHSLGCDVMTIVVFRVFFSFA